MSTTETKTETANDLARHTNVFVQGFGMNGTEKDLRKIFEDCGEICKITIKRKPDSNLAPYAFVEFVSEECADKALKKNDTKYETNMLKVELAHRSKPYAASETARMKSNSKKSIERNRNDDYDKRYDDRDRDIPPPRSDPPYDSPRNPPYDRYDDRPRYDPYYDRPRYPEYDPYYDRSRYPEYDPYYYRRYDPYPPPRYDPYYR